MKRKLALVTALLTLEVSRHAVGQAAPGTVETILDRSIFGGDFALDADENLILSDQTTDQILRFDRVTESFTVIAGNGTRGFSGDGGPAVDASLAAPSGLTFGPDDALYFSDQLNHRVRRIDLSSGVIETVVGQGPVNTLEGGFSGDERPARDAMLSRTGGIAFDRGGNLFIADVANHRIRVVDGDTGIITTFAGSGPVGFGNGTSAGDGGPATDATLDRPQGVAFTSDGNVIIIESASERLRLVDITTGTITAFAGTGSQGFWGDGGPATNAGFAAPTGIAVDGDDHVFVADQLNCRIRRVDAMTQSIETIAGDGVCTTSGDGQFASLARFERPYQLRLNANGDLFVSGGTPSGQGVRIVHELAVPSGTARAFSGFTCSRGADGRATLAWTVLRNDLDTIDVYADGALLARLAPSATSFEGPDPGPGFHRYRIAGLAAGRIQGRSACGLYVPVFTMVACQVEGAGQVLITWQNATSYDAVEIVRDGEVLATLDASLTRFVDETAPPGERKYCLRARAKGRNLEARECCETFVVVAPVADLTCATEGTRVKLSWINGAAYEAIDVLRDGEVVAKLPGITVAHELCPGAGGFHDYTVRGLAGGIQSEDSVCPVVTPPPLPPGTPQFCEESGHVTIRWALADCYSGIEVLRDGVHLVRLGGNARSYRDRNQAGKGHTYSVAAFVGDFRTQPERCQEGGCRARDFRHGELNDDGRSDLSDAVVILGHLFLGAPGELGCEKAADFDDDGNLTITDPIALLTYLFLGGPPPAAPFVTCGRDLTPDPLTCKEFAACVPDEDPGPGRVITWGAVGILYTQWLDGAVLGVPTDTLRFYRNVIEHLAEGRSIDGQVRILYTAGCDPRVDPGHCKITDDFEVIRPFFDMVDGLGTIDFAFIDQVNLDDYSLVIAEFCGAAQGAFNTESEKSALSDHIADGGRAWVIGDNFCWSDAGSTASIATEVLAPIGLRFTSDDPPVSQPLWIPPAEQVGLLDGVTSLNAFRVTPQIIDHSFEPIVVSDLGVLSAILEQ